MAFRLLCMHIERPFSGEPVYFHIVFCRPKHAHQVVRPGVYTLLLNRLSNLIGVMALYKQVTPLHASGQILALRDETCSKTGLYNGLTICGRSHNTLPFQLLSSRYLMLGERK